ncbi:MAG: TIM barrel protein [Candidatus Micrarchaeia archaeon]|jgi:deoxyribonuclease-4
MQGEIRFGPAGIPIQCEGSTVEGVECCSKLGLTAMEMEFVRGVRMKEEQAKEVRKKAQELDISLSSHAPYYVNLCSLEEEKIANSKRNIFQSAQATEWAGGRITVFHPGYYQELSKEEAYKVAKKNLVEIGETLKSHKINVILGAETVGKKSQFGGFNECIKLSEELDFIQPVIDFSHLHARRDFNILSEEQYQQIFSTLEKHLGDYVRHFHSHFSEINYSDKGELNHLALGTNGEPPLTPLLNVLAENGYSGTIICETPKIELDSLKMKKEYENILKEKKTK